MTSASGPGPELLTVGHGTLGADDLAALLVGAGVAAVVDVRAFPGSRRHPQFGRAELQRWLPDAGVAYRWEPRLGGRRRRRADSPNVALRNDSFRAYADHMAGAEFRAGLADVLADAGARRTAVMCSESLWWRCHRRLVADAATLLDGATVVHLMHDGRTTTHVPTGGVRRAGDHLVYDVGGDVPLPL
jgi:uncharacterized protein (DUF488 family)